MRYCINCLIPVEYVPELDKYSCGTCEAVLWRCSTIPQEQLEKILEQSVSEEILEQSALAEVADDNSTTNS